jgi:hypothetical protein
MDQIYYEDCLWEIIQPDFLCIAITTPFRRVLTPYRRLSSATIHAHIGYAPIPVLHHKNIPVAASA